MNNNATGIVEIAIPKTLLSGNITIFGQDNKPIDFEMSETETHSNIILETSTDISRITILGTNVIPEFPLPILIISGALTVVIAYFRNQSRKSYFHTKT